MRESYGNDMLVPDHPEVAPERNTMNTRGGRLAYLHASNVAYEWLVQRVHAEERRGNTERILRSVEQAALYAMLSHAGRFADGAIENVALKIGSEMDLSVPKERQEVSSCGGPRMRRRVLHVATRVMGIGGHTRTIWRWILQDQESCHSVLLTDQRDEPIPSWLTEAVQNNGGILIRFPSGRPISRKAQELRNLARRKADLVVLHHHCFDVVPVVAFAVKDCPPVAILNHADHLFWLGTSVADTVINARSPGATLSAERRFCLCNTKLSIPLGEDPVLASREDARTALGIPQQQTVLLSVGRDEKYRPCGSYDFVATAARILQSAPDAHLYVVGVSLTDLSPFLRSPVHERLHFMGFSDDPSLYRAAADIYLESFPFGSQTALLEAALSGLPIVPAYAPLFPLLVAFDDYVHDRIPNPRSEKEYIERVTSLIREPEQRNVLGDSLRQRVLANHIGRGWGDQLAAVYRHTDRLTHNPRPIPVSGCESTDSDIGLTVWHAMCGGSHIATRGSEVAGSAFFNAASIARQMGNYTMARHFARRSVCSIPRNLRCWRLLALSFLGRTAKLLKGVCWWRAKR